MEALDQYPKSIEVTEMPEVAGYINLRVKHYDNEQIHFKIKRTTTFKKLMQAFVSRANLDMASTRFIFDGTRISETMTPQQLNMENADEIDVVTEQLGGESSTNAVKGSN